MKVVKVVGALCIRGDHLLITRRPSHKSHGGMWEFPGGKVEGGEEHTAALRRELQEELALEVEVGALTHHVVHDYENFVIDLYIYRCQAIGELKLVEVMDARWILHSELSTFTLTPADVPVAVDLATRGLPTLTEPTLHL